MLSVNNVGQKQNNPSFGAYKYTLAKNAKVTIYNAMQDMRNSTYYTTKDENDFFIKEIGDDLDEILTFAKDKKGKLYIASIVKEGSPTEKSMLEQILYHQISMPLVVRRRISDKKAKQDVERFTNLVIGK